MKFVHIIVFLIQSLLVIRSCCGVLECYVCDDCDVLDDCLLQTCPLQPIASTTKTTPTTSVGTPATTSKKTTTLGTTPRPSTSSIITTTLGTAPTLETTPTGVTSPVITASTTEAIQTTDFESTTTIEVETTDETTEETTHSSTSMSTEETTEDSTSTVAATSEAGARQYRYARQDQDIVSYHCYSIQIVDGQKRKNKRGCLAVPETKSGCAVLRAEFGCNATNCKVCSVDGCNSSGALKYSLVAFVITIVIGL